METGEIRIDTTNPDDGAMEELIELLVETAKRLDEQPSLEEKQEIALKKLDEILNWNIEHGYFETLFPIFAEFITYLPEGKLNAFFEELGKYSTLRIE